MDKFIYFDCECKNDPTLVGWKNYKAQGLSVAVIGYPTSADDGHSASASDVLFDENAMTVKHLFPDDKDLKYITLHDAKKTFKLLEKFIDKGYKIVGYNTKMYDNNLIAELAGKINPKEHIDKPIGGNKGETIWRDVEIGYLDFLISKEVGQWNIAKAIKEYRTGDITDEMLDSGVNYTNQIKDLLDENSFDIMAETINITGGKWASPFNLVCNLTIGFGKSDDGAEVPEMYAKGEIDRITKYCTHDVRLTWLLHNFIKTYKYLLIPQYKDMPNLMQYQIIKVPFDGSVKDISEKFIRVEHTK